MAGWQCAPVPRVPRCESLLKDEVDLRNHVLSLT